MKIKIYVAFAAITLFMACKKNDNVTEVEQQKSIVKEWVNKQENSSILKEAITLHNGNSSTITLDWSTQRTFQKNNRNFIEIPYFYNDNKTKSDRYLVVELKNNKVVSAKLKHVSLLTYLNNTYFAEYWYDAKGKLSELWQWRDNKFSKVDLNNFYETNSTSRTTSCYQMSGSYWTYSSGGGEMTTVTATIHYYYYTLCLNGGNNEDQDAGANGNDYGGGSSGGTGGTTTDPNADVITEELDIDCLKNAFTLINSIQNIGGTPTMQSIKNALGNSSITFNWNNAALGTTNSAQYSNSTSNGTGGYNITLNNSLLTSSSKEFISATILNSYVQGYTIAKGNNWANTQGTINNVMNAIANGVRQLHSSLPVGAEFGIALKVFYDGNGSLFNQTQLASHLNSYYIGLVNSGKIPMVGNPNSPNYQPASDYNGWQVAKNNVGAKYATNATSGTASICN